MSKLTRKNVGLGGRQKGLGLRGENSGMYQSGRISAKTMSSAQDRLVGKKSRPPVTGVTRGRGNQAERFSTNRNAAGYQSTSRQADDSAMFDAPNMRAPFRKQAPSSVIYNARSSVPTSILNGGRQSFGPLAYGPGRYGSKYSEGGEWQEFPGVGKPYRGKRGGPREG